LNSSWTNSHIEEQTPTVILLRDAGKERGEGKFNRKERKGRKKEVRFVGAGLKPALWDLAFTVSNAESTKKESEL